MKRLGLIISALVVVLGLSQCTKKPKAPVYGGGTEQTITFITGGGSGAKGDFEQLNNVLNYKWDVTNGETIYVYASTNGSTFEEGKSQYCGTLGIVSSEKMEDGTYSGTFTGSVSVPANATTMRFVYCGKNISVSDGAASVSFAEQYGKLTDAECTGDERSISSKLIAVCDTPYDESGNYENCSLTAQFGVVKFSFENFPVKDVITMKKISKTGINLNTFGEITYTDGTQSNLNNVNNGYYTVIMPEGQISYRFTCGERLAYKKAAITAGLFYTKKYNEGDPVILEVLPEGALPGEFSVGSDKKIHFSKGNLYYDDSEAKWRFEDNQCDYRTISGQRAVIGREYTSTPTDDWGLVNFSTKKTDFGKSYSYSDEETSAFDGDFIDWALNMENGWFTMSKDFWVYMIQTRANAANLYRFMSFDVKNGSGTKAVKGMVLLPDGTPTTAFDNITEIDDLENYDAIFFPLSGDRHAKVLTNENNTYYWTSTYKDCNHDECWRVLLNWEEATPEIEIHKQDRKYGRCVRLVCMVDPENDVIDDFSQENW